MKKIGVLGGTFDPVHQGHLQLAKKGLGLCGLDSILFTPSYHPPHKKSSVVTDFHHRVEMIRIAIDDIPQFILSTIEEELPTPTYTYDMLNHLQSSQNEEVEIHFIMGIDAFLDIQSWKNYAKLIENTIFIVSNRKGYIVEKAEIFFHNLGYECRENLWYYPDSKGKLYFQNFDIIDLSSSQVRSQIKKNCLQSGLILEQVREYIKINKLYK